MPERTIQQQLEEMADEILELTKLGTTARARARARGSPDHLQLSETEFLALDALAKAGTLTVGEIQKQIGVLPAQMSRIIRSLESKTPKPHVECVRDLVDKRKVNVSLSAAGKAVHTAYRNARLSLTMDVLSHLSQEDRDTFMRILRFMRKRIAKRLQEK